MNRYPSNLEIMTSALLVTIGLMTCQLSGVRVWAGEGSIQSPIKTPNSKEAVTMISFDGSVVRGGIFEKDMGGNLIFKVEPTGTSGKQTKREGWSIKIVARDSNEDRIMCYQFPHGGSLCQIWAGCGDQSHNECIKSRNEGWAFSGQRSFHFGLGQVLERTPEEIRSGEARPDPWNRFPKYQAEGSGIFIVTGGKTDKTVDEEEAKRSPTWIEEMKFRVTLQIPRVTKK